MSKLKKTNTKTLFELVGDPCSTSSSLGGSMFDYGEPPSLYESDNHKINEKYKNSKSKKVKRPLLDKTKGLPKNNDPIIEGTSTVWSEPNISPEDKFIDIPKEEVVEIKPINGSICVPNSEVVNFMDQFKPLQVSELPIHIVMTGKTYKVKEIEVDDWVKSIKEVITKYQKMNMLMLYLATSTYNSKSIDVEYYIKINNLEDLLIEV